jgi:hypothetical protein
MFLTDAAAKALAAIVLTNTMGANVLATQLPLHVEDRGDLWLVKGTPYDDRKLQLRYCQYSIFFRKSDAEIRGIGFAGRQPITQEQAIYWHKIMNKQEFERIFGPQKVFEPDPVSLRNARELYKIAYGGFINTPSAAVDYAHVLMETADPRLGQIPKTGLKAEERDEVWHVTVTNAPGFAPGSEILSISRDTGQLLSGKL